MLVGAFLSLLVIIKVDWISPPSYQLKGNIDGVARGSTSISVCGGIFTGCFAANSL